jgi:hypothetical protein
MTEEHVLSDLRAKLMNWKMLNEQRLFYSSDPHQFNSNLSNTFHLEISENYILIS